MNLPLTLSLSVIGVFVLYAFLKERGVIAALKAKTAAKNLDRKYEVLCEETAANGR